VSVNTIQEIHQFLVTLVYVLRYGTEDIQILGVFAKLQKANIMCHVWLSICPSIGPHGASRLPLDRFPRNSKFYIWVCFESV